MRATAADVREIPAAETHAALPALLALRPAYGPAESLLAQVALQRNEGYRLAGVFEADATTARAVAGFRVAHTLSWGRHVYLDDLSTLPAFRGRGYGAALLEWVHEEATRLRCDSLQLDSAADPTREAAHRLYLNARYRINAFHFERRLGRATPT